MRRVQVFKSEQVQKTLELERGKSQRLVYDKIPDGEGWFHKWGVDYEEFETGPRNFTTAIVERDDGTIETPPANMIKFTDHYLKQTNKTEPIPPPSEYLKESEDGRARKEIKKL